MAKKPKLGPRIGSIPAKMRRKTHPKYRKSRRQHTLTLRHDMPGNSGFLYLEGTAVYNATDNLLLIRVSSKRREGNFGPGIYEQRTIEGWNRVKNEDGSVPEAIRETLQGIAARVAGREYPERDMFIERCNNTGQTLEAFLEETCAKCTCWYCELASP